MSHSPGGGCGTPGDARGRVSRGMPPTTSIYTLLTHLPVYHYRPRYTGEGVREARAWVWQLVPAIAGARASPGGGICFSIFCPEDRVASLQELQINVGAWHLRDSCGGGTHEGTALKTGELGQQAEISGVRYPAAVVPSNPEPSNYRI